MKVLRKRIAVLLILAIPVAVFANHTRPKITHLKIIHWNDFHAQNEPVTIRSSNGIVGVGGFAYFVSVIDSLRAASKASGVACLALDAGDEFQGTIISSITKGKSQFDLLNSIHPDAVTIGNHEFDYGWNNLRSLLARDVTFPIVNANIVTSSGKHIAKPYIIRDVGGMRIAIIGLTTSALRGSTMPDNIKGLTIEEYDDVLPSILREVKTKHPTLIFLLTHIGVDEDVQLARKYPEVNVIVGGHSHTALFEPKIVGKTEIVQAGSKGRYVGELDLDVDLDGDSLIHSSGKLIEVRDAEITPDPQAASAVASLVAEVNKQYDVVIGSLNRDWKQSRDYNGNLSTFEADAFRRELGTDIGCINHGGMRKSLLAGAIAIKDIYEINPFQNEMYEIAVNGATLVKMLEWMLSGSASESCEFAGIECTFNKETKHITSALVTRTPIDNSKIYTIATNAFVESHLKEMFALTKSGTADFTSHSLSIIDAEVITNAVRDAPAISGEPIVWLTITGK